jgi:DNA-binding helix-hairpin-helix protein with protein kinase domain
MFDPLTGDVLICDNDNVGVQNYSRSLVSGTLEFMAPELINGNAEPSVETDLHSLAVLLFHLWIWHNPLHGLREYNIRSWDLPAKRKVYGENPLFIFDPDNHDNCLPNDPEYNTPLKFWSYCPEPLKRMFTRAFTNGLKHPYERVNEGEWKNLFLELGDCIIHCPRDNAEIFWYEGVEALKCWYCKEDVDVPVRLAMNTKSGRRYVLLTKDAKLLERHINLYADEKKRNNILGDLVQNPGDPSVWGLRNLTDLTWLLTLADGTVKEVPQNRSAPLSRGAVLNFGNEATGIFEK